MIITLLNMIILYIKIESTNSTEIPDAEPESAQPEMGDSGDEVSDTTILSEISTTEESETGMSLSIKQSFYLVIIKSRMLYSKMKYNHTI